DDAGGQQAGERAPVRRAQRFERLAVAGADRVGGQQAIRDAALGDGSIGNRHQSVLLTRAVAATFSGSGVKSSPGLMKRSFSKRYCLSWSWRYRAGRTNTRSWGAF